MTNEELLSKTIAWLRFPLAVAIVFVHTVNSNEIREYVSTIDYSILSDMDFYYLTCYLFSEVIFRVATSCFCIFSGFLFFYKLKEWNRNIYFQKIKRKTRTLVIPYILWNIIPIVLAVLRAFMKFDGSLSIYLNELLGNGIFRIFWNYQDGLYPYNVPLWFLRDLIIVVFLSPLVYYFVKYTKYYSLFILGFFFSQDLWFPVVSIRALFFFTIGACFSIHGKNMIVELRKGKWLWLSVSIITIVLLMCYNGSDNSHYFYVLFQIAGCITTINIASRLLESGRVVVHPFLSKTSFFIFASHCFALLWSIQKMVNIIIDYNNAFILTIKYFMVPTICVCVCLVVYYAAQKTIPRLLGILTGSR